jgi:hypothetical protein
LRIEAIRVTSADKEEVTVSAQHLQKERNRIEAERVRLNGPLPETANVRGFENGTLSLTFVRFSTRQGEQLAKLIQQGSEQGHNAELFECVRARM